MSDSAVVTQKMIAEELNIDKSTVSLGLRNDPQIPQRTRDKIHAMARVLDYKPNPLLGDLARQRWKDQKVTRITIGCIGESRRMNIGTPCLISKAIKERANELGYHVDFFYLNEYCNSMALQKVLISRGIRDLIINVVLHQNIRLELDWSRFIAVLSHSSGFSTQLHAVAHNHYGNLIQAWKKAVEYGYKRIGAILFKHEENLIDDELRIAGMLLSQKHLFPDLPAIKPFEIHVGKDFPYPMEACRRWVKKNRLDVVIGFHGGHYQVLQSIGDESIGFINLHLTPEFGKEGIYLQAGVESRAEEVGIEAANLLHMCRKTNQWGIPARRIEHVINAVWSDGLTLPRRLHSLQRSTKTVRSGNGADGRQHPDKRTHLHTTFLRNPA